MKRPNAVLFVFSLVSHTPAGIFECARAGNIGPDVIVGEVNSVNDYARLGDTAAIAMTTVSCNVGDQAVDWIPLPSNQHPVIAQNMYRLLNGRFEQIGMAWVKHGFAALQGGTCYADCSPHPTEYGLGVHCSDPYSASINQGPGLGPRSEINPVTGYFDGTTANDHSGHIHSAISHGLQVKHADLEIPGARYFVEAQYLSPDDAMAGNGNNNASWREVAVTGSATDWLFFSIGSTMREQPAIFAWPGATHTVVDGWPVDGRIIVASNVTSFGGGQYRYDYAVYNMNSAASIRSLSVPVGDATISNVGFHAVLSHDEGFSNDPWSHEISGGEITWSTDSYADNPNANAIRWGTMFNFWFEADVSAVPSAGRLGRFQLPAGGSAFVQAWLRAPAPSDCNDNGTADDQDIAAGSSSDCNLSGIPDECEVTGNDCNGNLLPDECDLDGGASLDCTGNVVPDECDIASGAATDCNGTGIPDECESFFDCNGNDVPDECELFMNDCNDNLIPDECEGDCDGDGIIDACAIGMDCNENGVPDPCDVGPGTGGLVQHESGSINAAIPDGDPSGTSHVIHVTQGGQILDVDVHVQLFHTWVGDLNITLTHAGRSVVLWNRVCESNNHIDATFDDDGPEFLVCGNPTTGTQRPESANGTPLATMNGLDAAGPWALQASDLIPSDVGSLQSWTLILETPFVPPISQDANGNGLPDECESCLESSNCDDGLPCTVDECVGGFCSHIPHAHGDVNLNGAVDIDDIVCVVDGYFDDELCPRANLFPCAPDNVIDVDDIAAILDAYAGLSTCCGD